MSKRDTEELIEKNLENIEEWCRNGLTLKQIAQNIGISYETLYRHQLKPDSALKEAIRKGRQVAITNIENSMYQSAVGYSKVIKKHQKLKRILYENGKKAEEYEEMVEYEEEVFFPSDNTAAIFLLKNWARYSNEPVTNDLRKREVDLKEKVIESNNW